MKKLFLYILLFISSSVLYAQFDEFHSEYDWYTIKGKHCFVHFHAEAERTAMLVAKICDEVWDPITSFYQYEPDPVNFIIKDIDDYSNGATYYFDNKIEIWASALEFDLRGSHNWLRNVISHEFTHMVQLQKAMKITRQIPAVYLQFLNYEDKRRPDILYGYPNFIISYPLANINVPSWFAEGVAQYQRKEFGYENWDTHRDMILRCFALENKLLTWNEMGVFNKNSLGNEAVYNSGFALVRYISQKYGEDKIVKITDKLSKFSNVTMDGAVKDVLGISGDDLYNDWAVYIKKSYSDRMKAVLQNKVEGNIIAPEGIGNFHPKFSDDSKKIYYVSTKSSDYFSLSSLFILDIAGNKEDEIESKIKSTISQIPNTSIIVYSKLSDNNKDFRNIHDIYSYDLTTKKEKRITSGLRANYPSVSHNGKDIVFIYQMDGTSNLGIVNVDGSNFRKVTLFKNGEQVFSPVFSKDDKNIIFDLSYADNRDIVQINIDGSGMEKIISSEADERNPFVAKNGEIIYSSDESGIFNIYSFNPVTKIKKQLTNVAGGAFMPALDNDGNLVYSGYTTDGFKIFLLKKEDYQKTDSTKKYTWIHNPPTGEDQLVGGIDKDYLAKIKNYNDYEIPNYTKERYTGFFSRISIYPSIRYDNYNLTTNALDRIKPGVILSSSDALNRYSMLASAYVNRNLERDLYLSVEYRDKVPLLSSIGLRPQIGVELYSISRQTNVNIPFGIDSSYTPVRYDYQVGADLTYNLFEADFIASHKLFSDNNKIELRFIFSQYISELGSFIIPESNNYLNPATTDKYFIGRSVQFKFTHDGIIPATNMDINPIGRKIDFQYNYDFNRFNNESRYEVVDDIIKPIYNLFDFHRLELNWKEYIPLSKNATFNLSLRAGAILGVTVPDFFDFYLGGILGMKSFPFYSISGNRVLWINASYRFPLWQHIDTRLGQIYIDNAFLSVYTDIGNAWNGPFPLINEFKKGVGMELRVKMNSFYIFPTTFFINAAYSFDSFRKIVNNETFDYGKQIEIYGGILFDFAF